ncbi:MAG: universal stress protein [Frankiales bacterium]|nr:universal stress protein [Frankiales bacterium]
MTSTPSDTTTPVPAPQRIVVGVDGSAGSDAALAWALRQAWAHGGSVTAVGSWQTPAMNGMAGYASYVDMSSYDLGGPTQEVLDKAVAAASADLPLGVTVPVTTRVVSGYPARELLKAAADAELLVVGSRGHGELSGMLLGSVGLHCVTHATCPVVVVHPTPAS